MPIYEYNCNKCNAKFEKIVSSQVTDSEICCPSCSEYDCRRMPSLFASKITGKHGATKHFSSSHGGSGCSSCHGGTCSTCG